jgi:tetratricopeptide (TPR) repeat protein
MKLRTSLLIIACFSTACFAAKAKLVDESELKSDLELEIEGTSQKPSRIETHRKRKPASQPAAVEPAKLVSGLEVKIEEAKRQLVLKKFDVVIQTLLPINDVLPRSGLLILAHAYAGKVDTLNEIRTLELCVNKNPKDYVVKNEYGKALVRAKRVEDALVAFQESRELNPRYKPAYESLVKELELKGERYEARNVVSDMIKIFGPQPSFYTSLCRLYALDNFSEKTIEVCEEAILKDPKAPDNHMYLGLTLRDHDEVERANQVLVHASKRFPASESVQSAIGDLYFTKKDFVNSYSYFKKATAADPKSARAWVGYGNAAFKLQKNQEALDAFMKGCKLDRTQIKEFRFAIGELRVRKDVTWQSKYETSINDCP